MLPLYQNTLKLIRSAFKYMRIFGGCRLGHQLDRNVEVVCFEVGN